MAINYLHVALVLLLSFLVSCERPETTGQASDGNNLSGEVSEDLPEQIHSALLGKMILLGSGTFIMGATDTAPAEDMPERQLELPHEVRMRSVYMQSTPVTNKQFLAFVGQSGYVGSGGDTSDFLLHMRDNKYASFRGPQQPVIFVSFDDAVAFCKWLSKKEGRTYRLPTEEEWEYGCKGAHKAADAIEKPLHQVAWFRDNSGGSTRPVALKEPNILGLHDMLGNVWEWTSSRFSDAMVANSPFVNSTVMHIRGGDWGNASGSVRCSARWAGWPPFKRDSATGFRVVAETGNS